MNSNINGKLVLIANEKGKRNYHYRNHLYIVKSTCAENGKRIEEALLSIAEVTLTSKN